MKKYLANASSDWGHIFTCEEVKASSFGVAFRRAGHLAQTRCRRRPKQITISIRLVGTIQKAKEDVSYLGLPEDQDTPEKPL
jgi:hypothetical protein